MASKGKSRWADDEEDNALDAQRKAEKEAKKSAKAEKQRQLQAAQERKSAHSVASTEKPILDGHSLNGDTGPPAKRRKVSPSPSVGSFAPRLLRFPAPSWGPCRHVDNFEKLNHIEEGSYGWVSRAKEVATGEVVALKKLKMEPADDGFPVTGLREIQTLMACRHEGIVGLREIVMGDGMEE